MNDNIRSRWDQWFLDDKSYQVEINYTPWLERYPDIFPELKTPLVLDLGCGRGFDTKYLIDFGLTTISADFSLGALYAARKTKPSSRLLQFDLRQNIPFADNTFGLIVANLSLHYFSTPDTIQLVDEIHRVLAKNVWLIARMNSTSEYGFQSVKDDARKQIEEDYFVVHGIPRRYFREDSIRQFFSKGWKIDHIEEKKLMRYGKPKYLWEFTVQKTTINP